MSRAERRRAEREKLRPSRTYTLTDVEIRKIKADATRDAVNTALTLMLVFPLEVLMEDYWPKTYVRRLPKFVDKVLEKYNRYLDGEVDLDVLRKDLWERGGVRFEEVL